MEHMEKINKSATTILEKAVSALDRNLCDHCLGRLFARAGFGLTNHERGKAIRIMLALSSEDLGEFPFSTNVQILEKLPVHQVTVEKEENEEKDQRFIDDEGWVHERTPSFNNFLSDEHDSNENRCWMCHDVFDHINELVDIILEKTGLQEFNTFQVGSRIDPATSEKERLLWESIEPANAEPLKEELNREIGKALSPKIPDKVFDRSSPDVIFLVDPLFRTVEVKKRPLFIYGRYEKLVRGIPQSRWICKKCRGKGCSLCQGKGKMYETSVEEEIGTHICDMAGGSNYKIHGKGREDVDVRWYIHFQESVGI